MLYDPKWERPLTVAGLMAWLEQQAPDTEYQDEYPATCLVATYLGRQAPDMLSKYDNLNHVVYPEPHTYGAALARARALMQVETRS